jgi:uncharacterized membrane protein
MTSFKKSFVASLAVISPIFAMAHEGHGVGDGNDVMHYFASFAHAAPFIIGFAVVVFFIARKRKRSSAR